ncbi:FHA domain-containing protein [Kribbella sp. NPDC059898]|uniref:FHA domain-containing protein n=1 Tax=Kribbella sp. NPDC059898 TaxID=3346995 RepID=UPI00364A46B3
MSSLGVGTRPSDAERDRALSVLRDGAGSGRLSHDTFVRRMNVVLRAQTHGELADVLRDLPRRESRVTTITRNLREKLPRLALDRPSRSVPRWDVLARLSVVRKAPTPAPPALALPAPGSPTVRVGRGPGATLRLGDVTVSRFHAELRYVGEGWLLRDLGSMNGTCVNDLRITTTVRVRPGDRVSFGAVSFTLTQQP